MAHELRVVVERSLVLVAVARCLGELRGRNDKLFGFFVGQVMKAMAGKANPQVVNERLRAKLD